MAELRLGNDSSGLIFDDPVSSLDHHIREHVARRLVQAAKERQVIVFTHDLAFLAHDHAPAAGGQSYSVEEMKADLQVLIGAEKATPVP